MVEPVAGVVTSLSGGSGGTAGGGIHLALLTDACAVIAGRLGPASYVDRQSSIA